jgi:hypothetical protein
MDIEDFVKDVLEQITNAVSKNTAGGKIKYISDYTKGVDFDLAVTTANTRTTGKSISGGLKVKVIGADAGKNSSTNTHQETTSRVSFNVKLIDNEDTGQSLQAIDMY